MALAFEWDRRKAESNRKKHGIRFEEAVAVFHDPLARIFDDPAHSSGERREILIGRSADARLLLICFKEVGVDRVRIISAREATRRERRDYEENIKG